MRTPDVAVIRSQAGPSRHPRRPAMKDEGFLTRCARELHSPDGATRDEAARQLWLHFSARLGAVVRRRLDARVLRRVGLDDVLQSLFAGYCAAGPGPDGPPPDRAVLWRQLVCFTMRKVASTAKHHHAQRRDVRRERPLRDFAADAAGPDQSWIEPKDFRAVRRPALRPDDVVVARDEFERLLALLPADLQRVFALKLEDYTNAEIAAQIDRGERTVELKMRAIRGLLGDRQ